MVQSLIQGDVRDFWIGLNDRTKEGVYKWAYTKDEANFTMWAVDADEPTGADDEDCVAMINEEFFRWGDFRCTGEYKGAVCFMEPW